MTQRERLIQLLTIIGAVLTLGSVIAFGSALIWGGNNMQTGWLQLLLGLIALLAGVVLSLGHPERPD